MSEAQSHIDLIERIRTADPARSLLVDPDQLQVLLAAATIEPHQRRRPARWALIAGGLAAVVAFGVATPAIADGVHHFLAQTGWIGTSPNPVGIGKSTASSESTESDQSEWISTSASDFVSFSVSVFPQQITLPAQYDPSKFARVVAVAQQAGFPTAGLVQTTAIQANYETVARCAWIDEWLSATNSNNTPRADAAAAILTSSATWPATVATDGGNIVSSLQAVAAAATAGNRTPVIQEQSANCAPIPAGATR